MISLRLFIATLALAVKLDSVRAASSYMFMSPASFYYKQDAPYDNISINIILKNVPAEANSYVLYYQTGNCAEHSAGCDVPARSNWIPENRTITITEKLNSRSVRIYIELRKESKICATKQIMDGTRDVNAYVNQLSNNCLNFANLCGIVADFKYRCEGSPAKVYCSQSKRLTCEVLDEELPEDTAHQWYQAYKDGSLIGTIPPVKGTKTKFKMTFHKFDSNTYISSIMNSAQWKTSLPTEKVKVPLPTNEYKNYEVKLSKKYTADQPVRFNCANNAHTQIGWIEATGNKIATYNETTISSTLTKEYNGTMLCCLNYETYTVGNKTIVERIVTNITVLIYEEPVIQDSKVSITDRPLTPQEPTSTSTTSTSTTSTSTTSRQHTHNTPSYYIAIAAVAGTILLASLIYVVIKKCYRKSSDPEQTLQLETYATTNMVLYAELDIRPGTGPAPASTENATYAEIIGVLRPENGHVKK